jgi:hypothetical protein
MAVRIFDSTRRSRTRNFTFRPNGTEPLSRAFE